MKFLLFAVLICFSVAQPRSFTRSRQFDFQRMSRIPRGITPLCEGVKNTVTLRRIMADSKFEIHQPEDCSGTNDITFNNRYVLRYKRVDVQNHTRFIMHMIGMNATVNTESGVQHLKNLIAKYCPALEVTTGSEINLMRLCRRFAFREFHAHFAGSYYMKDGKTYITLIDPFNSPASAEPIPFEPMDCPSYPNEDKYDDTYRGNYKSTVIPITRSPASGVSSSVAPTGETKKDESEKPTTVAPTGGNKKDGEKPTTLAPTTAAPTGEKKDEKKDGEKPTTVAPTTAAPTTAAPTKA